MLNETPKPECCTDLDVHRGLTSEESEELARLEVMLAHQALMDNEAKARDARANAADAAAEKAEEETKTK